MTNGLIFCRQIMRRNTRSQLKSDQNSGLEDSQGPLNNHDKTNNGKPRGKQPVKKQTDCDSHADSHSNVSENLIETSQSLK